MLSCRKILVIRRQECLMLLFVPVVCRSHTRRLDVNIPRCRGSLRASRPSIFDTGVPASSRGKRGAPTRSAAGGTREVLLHPNQSGRHAAGNMCGHVASRRNRTNAVAIRWCQTKLIDSYGAGA